jgi:hypothetical protein
LVVEVRTQKPAKVIHDLRRQLGKEPVTAVVAVDAVEFEASGGSSRLVLLFENCHAGGPFLHKPQGCAYAGGAGSENHDVRASGKIYVFLHENIPLFHFIHSDFEECGRSIE